MRGKKYSTEAIILSKKDYSEADRIITVFTSEYGKLSLLAKGVRNLKSKKRGAIEVFHRVKLSAVKGHDLDIVTEVDLRKTHQELKNDLRKMSVGYFFCEVVMKLTEPDSKSYQLFETLNYYFDQLNQSNSLQKTRRDFIYDILVDLGFWPEGQIMQNPDQELQEIVDRKLNTPDIARKILS